MKVGESLSGTLWNVSSLNALVMPRQGRVFEFRTHATFLAWSLDHPRYTPTHEQGFHFGAGTPSAKALSRT
eukprot:3998206-Ditylum_brightwellii.AAC.1